MQIHGTKERSIDRTPSSELTVDMFLLGSGQVVVRGLAHYLSGRRSGHLILEGGRFVGHISGHPPLLLALAG